jgi:hypothetical protein
MKILSFFIPKELQGNQFILSLYRQTEISGKDLSLRQINALKDMLDIDEEFYDWDYKCLDDRHSGNYTDLKNKLIRNKFRTIKGKNKCVRAMQSIIDGKPDHYLIQEALGTNFNPRRYWR